MTSKTHTIVYTGIFAVLLSICSWISIPTVIPFTLQTFGVFFTLFMLGGKHGTLTICVYLLLGLIGIPVFSHFGAGLGVLFGSTGGYILGFVFTGLVMYFFDRTFGKKMPFFIIASLIGLVACYAFGTFWFLMITGGSGRSLSIPSVLGICVFPFIIPDLCKLWLAYILYKKLKPQSLHFTKNPW